MYILILSFIHVLNGQITDVKVVNRTYDTLQICQSKAYEASNDKETIKKLNSQGTIFVYGCHELVKGDPNE